MGTIRQSLKLYPNPAMVGYGTIFKGVSTIPTTKGKKIEIMQSVDRMYGKDNQFNEKESKIYQFYFTKQTPVLEINYVWQTDENHQLKHDKDVWQSHVLAFLKNHEFVELKTGKNPNCKIPFFILEIMEDTRNKKMNLFNQRLHAMNIINGMDEIKKRDVLHYFDIDSYGMTQDEVLIALADNESGIAISENNIERFIEIFGGEVSENIADIITVKKAISYNFLTKQGDYIYNQNNDILGTTPQEAVINLKSNGNMFEIIRNRVNEHDLKNQLLKTISNTKYVEKPIGEGDKRREILEKNPAYKNKTYMVQGNNLTELANEVVARNEMLENTGTDIQMESLREKAREVGIKAVHLYKDADKLKEAIEKSKKG